MTIKIAMLGVILYWGQLCFAQTEDSNQKSVYFLEARTGSSVSARTLRSAKQSDAPAEFVFAPGDLIRVTTTPESYLERIRSESKNEGLWLDLQAISSIPERPLFLYDSWRAYQIVDGDKEPVNLTLNIPPKQKVISLFSEPRNITWKECSVNPDLCVAWPNRDAVVRLLDTRLVHAQNRWGLFYKVSYQYDSVEKGVRTGEGWVPSRYLKRALVLARSKVALQPVPTEKKISLSEEELNKLLAENEAKTIAKLFPGVAAAVDEKKFSRWRKAPAADARDARGVASDVGTNRLTSESLQFKVDFDLFADLNFLNLKRSGNGAAELSQQGMRVGVAGVLPILMNLEAGGSLSYVLPLKRSPEVAKSADVFRFEQYIVRQIPDVFESASLRVGPGWHLMKFADDTYGYTVLAGLELMALVDDTNYFSYFKLGPVANSSGVSLKNIEVLIGGGWRLDPSQGAQSWNIFAELWRATFTPKTELNSTEALSVSVGVRKTL